MNKQTVCNSFSKKVWNNLVRQRSSVGEQLKPPMDLELVKEEQGLENLTTLLKVLDLRMSRLQDSFTSNSIHLCLHLKCNENVKAFLALLRTRYFCFSLKVYESVDRDGWEALARTMRATRKNPFALQSVNASRFGLFGVGREDIKRIWETVRDKFIVWGAEEDFAAGGRGYEFLVVHREGLTWDTIEQILNMTEDEFIAKYYKGEVLRRRKI